ncbi:MAG: hypothetical protein QG621_259 [Patescibacteria group bacterium]|nr:hypothetical protein [Patescibacteria group bacterium]
MGTIDRPELNGFRNPPKNGGTWPGDLVWGKTGEHPSWFR